MLMRRQSWDRMREEGRRFVEGERNWSASVARYRHVYRLALGRERHARG
jgi:glycogen synthase